MRQNIAFAPRSGWLNPRRDVRRRGGRPLDRGVPARAGRRALSRTSSRAASVSARRWRARWSSEPTALLLDEPFAALDKALRQRLREELKELQARLGMPMLLITHDDGRRGAFADEVVHLDAGTAIAAPTEFLEEHLMKSSARNQFAGTVSAIIAGAVNDEVEIAVGSGQHIVATVTHGSTVRLGLAVGVDAFALVKASSIVVVADPGTALLSARNQLAGTVASVQPGAVNAEVEIDAGGLRVVAIVTQASARAMALAPGVPAIAVFKASSVIVGVTR